MMNDFDEGEGAYETEHVVVEQYKTYLMDDGDMENEFPILSDRAMLEERLESSLMELKNVKNQLEEERKRNRRATTVIVSPRGNEDEKNGGKYEEQIVILRNKVQFQSAEINELYDKIQSLQREKLMAQKSYLKNETETEEYIKNLEKSNVEVNDKVSSLAKELEERTLQFEVEINNLRQQNQSLLNEVNEERTLCRRLEVELSDLRSSKRLQTTYTHNNMADSSNNICEDNEKDIFEKRNYELEQEITRLRLLKVSSDQRVKDLDRIVQEQKESLDNVLRRPDGIYSNDQQHIQQLELELEEKRHELEKVILERNNVSNELAKQKEEWKMTYDTLRLRYESLKAATEAEKEESDKTVRNLEEKLKHLKIEYDTLVKTTNVPDRKRDHDQENSIVAECVERTSNKVDSLIPENVDHCQTDSELRLSLESQATPQKHFEEDIFQNQGIRHEWMVHSVEQEIAELRTQLPNMTKVHVDASFLLQSKQNAQIAEYNTRLKKLRDKNLKARLRIEELEHEVERYQRIHESKCTAMRSEFQNEMSMLKENYENHLGQLKASFERQKGKVETEKETLLTELVSHNDTSRITIQDLLYNERKQISSVHSTIIEDICPLFPSILIEYTNIRNDVVNLEMMCNSQLEELRVELDRVVVDLFNTTCTNGLLSQEIDDLKSKEIALSSLIESYERELSTIQNKYTDLETKYLKDTSSLQAELSRIEEERKIQVQLVTQRDQTIRSSIDSLEQDNKRLITQLNCIKQLQEQELKCEREKYQTDTTILNLQDEVRSYKKKEQQYREKLDSLRYKISILRSELDESRLQNQELSQQQESIRKNLSDQIVLIEQTIAVQEYETSQELQHYHEKNMALENDYSCLLDRLKTLEVRIQVLEQENLDLVSQARTDQRKIAQLTLKLQQAS